MSWIADELARSWGNGASWKRDAGAHPHEAHFLKLDASKARSSLGWRPFLPLHQALQWIIEWYRAFQAGADLRFITLTQIERYQALSSELKTNSATSGHET